MTDSITISETEKATNISFQIKQLLIALQKQTKPQLANAIALMEQGAEDVSKEAINKAFGDSSKQVLEKIKAIVAVL